MQMEQDTLHSIKKTITQDTDYYNVMHKYG